MDTLRYTFKKGRFSIPNKALEAIEKLKHQNQETEQEVYNETLNL